MNTTEQQMLERAARSAHYIIVSWRETTNGRIAVLADGSYWQPLHRNELTDWMGDALRLALKLGIKITPFVTTLYIEDPPQAEAEVHYFTTDGLPKFIKINEDYDNDPDAAVCSVIVQVAANMI